MSTLERAIAIAAEAHAGQTDKGGAPYVLHPLRVMMRLRSDADMIVAVLHDVVEDCPEWPLDRLAREGFAGDVLDAVEAVTRLLGESYDTFIARAGRNEIARRVKLADLAENMDLSRISAPTAADERRVAKYVQAKVTLELAEIA